MGLISTSVVSNINATGNLANLVKTQSGGLTSPLPTLTSAAQNSVTTVVTGSAAASALVSGASNFSVTPESVAAAGAAKLSSLNPTTAVKSAASAVTSQVSGIQGQATGFLNKALSSISASLSGSVTQLASGIDSALSGIFKNKTIATAANVITAISDPLKSTLLSSKPPASTSFSITPIEAGSQSVTMTGSSPTFGSNATSMVGTSLTTLTNRFNLSSVSNLAKAITTSTGNAALSKLFANPTSLVKSVAVTAVSSALTKTPVGNAISSITGKTSTLSALTGVNPLNYFVPNKTAPLYNTQTGATVTTSSASADANTANQIIAIARAVGCTALNNVEYGSSIESGTLFGTALAQAASLGLDDILSELLGCNQATSTTAQTSIVTAFTEVSGTNITTANQLASHIENTSALNSDGSLSKIIANANLTSKDLPTVDDVMSKLGTTTQQAYCTGALSTNDLPVYDAKKVTSSNTEFTNAVFPDKTLTTYIYGQELTMNSTGLLG